MASNKDSAGGPEKKITFLKSAEYASYASERDPLLDSGKFSKSLESGRLGPRTEEVTWNTTGLYAPYTRSLSKSGRHRKSIIDEEEEERSRKKGCHRPRFIEPVVFLYYLAYNCTVPIQEQFVTKLVRDFYSSNNDYLHLESADPSNQSPKETCGSVGNQTSPVDALTETLVQSQASLWLMYLKLASSIPAMLATLIICSYGDIGGRKLGILLPPAGCAIKSIFFILAMYVQAPLPLLFVGSFIEGCLGSHLTFMGSSYAYMADCTPNAKRPLRFTILQCSNTIAGLAHIPFGYWIDAAGFLQPFWFVAGAHIFVMFYVLFLIPESHPPPEDFDQEGDPQKDSTVAGMFTRAARAFFIYSGANPCLNNWTQAALILLLCSFVCRVFFEMGKSAVETLFMLAAPLCLSSTVIGYFNALNAFTHGVFGLVGTAMFLRCFAENTVCVLFTLSTIAGRLVFAYSSNVWILFLVPFVSFGQSATLSLTRAMMSSLVSPQQQGALFATIFTMESVCEVFSGALFNTIYAATVGSFKGFVFIVQAAILGLAALFLVIQGCVMKIGKQPGYTQEPSKIVHEINVEQ